MNELLNQSNWDLAAAISTTLVGIIALGAAFVARTQLNEMSKFRHLEAMLRVYELIGNETSREDRRILYDRMSKYESNESLKDDERKRIERVSTTFDRIGKLVKSNLVPTNEFLESNCEVVIRTWCVLEKYLTNHKDLIGGRHCSHFKYLNDLAIKYHCENYPKDDLKVVDSEGKTLVEIHSDKNGKTKTIKIKEECNENTKEE